MKKILFFDIDGTLAVGRKITDENKENLKKLKENGYLTFICTGRAPFYASKLFGDLVSGYICCNGRYILYNNEKIHAEPFDDATLKMYRDRFDTLDAGYFLVSDQQSYIYNLTDTQIKEVIESYGSEHITKVNDQLPFYTFDLFYKDLKHRDQIRDSLKDLIIFNDHGGHGSADCSTIGYDKGDAIAFCLKYFNIQPENSYAFGDGENDVAMFRVAGNKIAMGNAVNQLKEKATYITTDVNDHGISNALKHFHLI